MFPELFEIPFVHLTVKSYGLMMVVGFLCAISIIRRLSRNITPDPQMITNAALYSLIAGVVGARAFYVAHHWHEFQHRPASVFAIWQGGLELLGGVILAIIVILSYLRYHKLPIRRYLDILAVGLMAALVFGRIGCFLNGCCFGKPTELPWTVRFPYAAPAYRSQVYPDPQRHRDLSHLQLPPEYFDASGLLKPYQDLTDQQKYEVDKGPYRCLPVHPSQLYGSLNAALGCLLLYLFGRRARKTQDAKDCQKRFSKSGCTFALMLIYYGFTRFFLESLRDDNPFEYAWWIIYKGKTISQNIGIYMLVLGLALMVTFVKMRPDRLRLNPKESAKGPA
jgi:phosphatidylglycerol:prolipoprotein diacylglycerol transferase